MKFEELVINQPYIQHLGVHLVGEHQTGLILRLDPSDRFIGNPMLGAFHGGVICGLLECATSLAIMVTHNLASAPQIINQTTSFLASASADRPITVEAEVTKPGRRIMAAYARAYQYDADTLVAKASTQFRADAART